MSRHSPVVFEVPGFWDFKNSRQALILILIQTLIFDQDSETRP